MASVVHYEQIGDAILQVFAHAKLGGGTGFDAAVRLPNGQLISCGETGEDLFPTLGAAVAAGRSWATRTGDAPMP